MHRDDGGQSRPRQAASAIMSDVRELLPCADAPAQAASLDEARVPETSAEHALARARQSLAPVPTEIGHVDPLRVARRDATAAFERAYVRTVLQKSGGNITRAAAIAEVSRQMIQKLMRKYGL